MERLKSCLQTDRENHLHLDCLPHLQKVLAGADQIGVDVPLSPTTEARPHLPILGHYLTELFAPIRWRSCACVAKLKLSPVGVEGSLAERL